MSKILFKSKRTSRLVSLTLMAVLSFYLIIGASTPAYAMHIMEGFLPPSWAIFWWVVALPFFALGLRSLTRITRILNLFRYPS